jgi:acetyl-CoA carboxylase biotin carboxyl carrier protein
MSDLTVRAEMPGIVSKIVAAPGDSVDAGDALVIMESMKMEIPVESPISGVVDAVLVNEGQQIDEGEVVATIAIPQSSSGQPPSR